MFMLVVIWHLAVSIMVIVVRLIDARRPSVFAGGIIDLRLESASAAVLAAGYDACLPVLVHHPDADRARQAPEQEKDDAETDGGFGDFALAHAAPGEGLTVALVVYVLVFGMVFSSLLDALRLPDTERDGGCEPEEAEEEVEAEVGVYVGEAPGAGPHWDHDLVDQGGDGEEALRRIISEGHWCQVWKKAYKRKVEADLAAMVARLGEDGKGEAAGDEGEEGLGCVEGCFRFLVVALLDAHGEGRVCWQSSA